MKTQLKRTPNPHWPGKRSGRVAAFALFTLLLAGLPGLASAKELTTLYATDLNITGASAAVHFDVTVGPKAIEITALTTNTAAVTPFTMRVYTRDGTWVGNTASMAGWTQVATGTGDGKGSDVPSPVTLNNVIRLEANTTYGFALEIVQNVGHEYTGGTGANQTYSNADLTIMTGGSSVPVFSALLNSPRVWNGSIIYRVDCWTEQYDKAQAEYDMLAAVGDINGALAQQAFYTTIGDYYYYAARDQLPLAYYYFFYQFGLYNYFYFKILPPGLDYYYFYFWYAHAWFYHEDLYGRNANALALFNYYIGIANAWIPNPPVVDTPPSAVTEP